jgi:fumarate reductase subunit D
MYCSACGQQISDNSNFCQACGKNISNNNTQNSQNTYNAQNAAVSQSDAARFDYAMLRLDLDRMLKQRRTCLIVGIIIGLCFVTFWAMIPEQTASRGIDENFMWVYPMLSALSFVFGVAMPFGMIPILNFTREHGFGIFGNLIFMVMLFLILAIWCELAGIPYAIWHQIKISRAKAKIRGLEYNASAA